jgi:two-component system, chemotaxis family, sensor kinase CheA
MPEGGDRARDEFLSEAQEIVEGLGRDLLGLDEGIRSSIRGSSTTSSARCTR